jgi:hypothetical protein
MDKFTTLTGVAAPMPIDNIDTDMIIPKQYLKTIKRTGLGGACVGSNRVVIPSVRASRDARRFAPRDDGYGQPASGRLPSGGVRFAPPRRRTEEVRPLVFGFSWRLGVFGLKTPFLRVGFIWISLDSLVRI